MYNKYFQGKWSPTVADIATIAMTTKSFATDVFLRDETTKTKTKVLLNLSFKAPLIFS